jgi:UDP-N-acetylmuramyl tripeptide synthase
VAPPDRLRAARATVAIAGGKTAGLASRALRRGGGTSLPGVVAGRLDPGLLARLAGRLPDGAVMVAGTNGKTTTARLLADIYQRAGVPIVHNRSGANLLSGMTATVVAAASLSGRLPARAGIFESDEFALPAALAQVRPRLVVLGNLFRDQLDRYGELDAVATAWARALRTLPADCTVVYNGDDPALVWLATDTPARTVAYGVDDPAHRLDALPHAADAAYCRRCGASLVYRAIYLAHLGDFTCPRCGLARPALALAATGIVLDGLRGLRARLVAATGTLDAAVPVPGFYNVYNLLAAVAAARALGLPDTAIAGALADFRAPFGRVERVAYQGRDLLLLLAKNPVGFNEVLRLLGAAPPAERGPVLIVINDLIADGRDVSWLWDVDFEVLADWPAPVLTGGLRADDMALRLKYAGRATPSAAHVDLRAALDAVVEATPLGGTAAILLTYTALLRLRHLLTHLGAVDAYWQQ